MGLIRKPLLKILFLTALLLQSGISIAQFFPVDTLAYLSSLYEGEGALEYNLIVAASKGYHHEVERMILLGADVNAETTEGATPLIFAVSRKMNQTVDVLLKYNADVNHITVNKETPLLLSVKQNNIEGAEKLIRKGADLNYQDQNGVTALNFASIYGYFYMVDLLLYYGADPDIKANDGTTPLMSAAWAAYDDVADLLIQNGANMESRDNQGFTPFLVAAQNGDTLLLNLLIKKGIDMYEKNIYNWDALNLTIKSGKKDAAEMLLIKGYKWTYSGGDALNPYNVAAKYKRNEMIDLLDEKKFPSKYKPGIDQMSISLSTILTLHDHYTGLSFSFKEPLLNAGFFTGFDTKLWPTKVLVKMNESLYNQYFDKSSVVYAGFFKEFRITDYIIKSNVSITTSLAGGYFFGNCYKGTATRPQSKLTIIPEVDVKLSNNKFTFYSGLEFMNTDFHKIGPLWLRVGCSYNIFFDNVRSPAKEIRWY